MPYKPKKPCRYPGCPELISGKTTPPYCDTHKKKKDKDYDKYYRDKKKRRLYNHRWRKAREIYLQQHPLCVECKSRGDIAIADVVDHITPHKGDYDLFWDEDNWQPLCETCHNRKTASEDGGFGK